MDFQLTAEEKKKYLGGRLGHQSSVHAGGMQMFAGFILLFGGLGHVVLAFSRPLGTLCFLLIELVAVIFFVSLAIPCKCGRVPVISAKGQLSLLRQRDKRYRVWREAVALIAIFLVTALLSLLMWVTAKLFGPFVMICGIGAVLSMFGSYVIAMAIMGKAPAVRLQREYLDSAKLNGDVPEELERLIAFHLKVGNFEIADEYSRKLLRMAESGH